MGHFSVKISAPEGQFSVALNRQGDTGPGKPCGVSISIMSAEGGRIMAPV
jgi:hypothetical protein